MAFSFSSFNKEFLFDLPEEIVGNYLKTAEAHEKYGQEVIPVIGFGVNVNKSINALTDKNGWIATEEEMINVPYFQIPEIEAMMADRNAVNLCRSGHMGAVITHYTNKYGDQIKFKWCDR